MSGSAQNQLFRASAGTGKTHQLVRTYIELVCGEACEDQGNAVAPKEILLATFTRNAAGELRERVRRELDERVFGALLAEMHQSLGSEKVERSGIAEGARVPFEAREAVESAAICTLDSLCRSLVQEYALELGVNPRVDLLDESEENEMLRELIHRELKTALAGQDGEKLRSALVGRSVDGIPGAKYGGSDVVSALIEAVRKANSLGLSGEDVLAALPEPPGDDDFQDILLHGLDELEACFLSPHTRRQDNEINKNCRARYDPVVKLRKALDRKPLLPLRTIFCELLGLSERRIQDLKKTSFYEILDRLLGVLGRTVLYPLGHALLSLLATILDRFERLQRDAGRYTFGLVQKLAVQALESEGVEGWKRFRYVIVDEAQDLSRMQARLLLGLWKPGANHLILCGDEKQSIYGWRDADPGVFAAIGRLALRDNGEEKTLRKSYRSNGPVIDFINSFFSSVGFTPLPDDPQDLELLDYGDETGPHWLLEGRTRVGDQPAVEFWDRKAEANNSPDPSGEKPEPTKSSSADRRNMEVRALIRRIQLLVSGDPAWMPEGGWDANLGDFVPIQGRAYSYRDITILLRRTTGLGMLEEGLRRSGIPFRVSHGRGFFARQEIRDLWHWSRVLVDSYDAVALAGVLRSPLFGVSDEALQQLCRSPERKAMPENGDGGEDAEAGTTAQASDDETLAGLFRQPEFDASALERVRDTIQREALKLAHDRITSYRRLIDVLPPAGILEQIIRERAYDAVLTGTFNGEQRLANIKKLLSWSRKWSLQRGGSLSRFADDLGDRIQRQEHEPDAPLMDAQHDAVSIMTVHGAKGMTTRVVLLMDLEERNLTSPWIWVGSTDADESNLSGRIPVTIGLSTKLDWSGQKQEWLEHSTLLAQQKRREALERRNLLYVALTRARDLVAVFSAYTPKDRGTSHWEELWREYFERGKDEPLPVRRGFLEELIQIEPSEIHTCPLSVGGMDSEETVPVFARAARGFPRVATTPTELGLLMQEDGVDAFVKKWWLGLPGLGGGVLGEEETGRLIEDAWEKADPGGLSAGILAHAALEKSRFFQDPHQMREELEAQTDRLPMTDDERACLLGLWENRSFLDWLAQVLGGAKEWKREWPFAVRMRSEELILDLRGSVDCLYRSEESGLWRIADYKFVRTAENDSWRRYEQQMMLYARAVRSCGLKLDETGTLAVVGRDGTFSARTISLPVQPSRHWEDAVFNAAKALMHLRRGELPVGSLPDEIRDEEGTKE